MDKLKHLLFLSVLLVLSTSTWSQKTIISKDSKTVTNAFDEIIFLHLNATTFVSGETLQYKLYCLNPVNYNSSKYSKIAYVELIDSNKKNVLKQKLFLENGTAQGDFFIPTALQSGNYKLIAYTNWMLNKSEEVCSQTEITLINPFQTNQQANINSADISVSTEGSKAENQSNGSVIPSESKKISIETIKKTYTNREFVSLKIKPSVIDFEKGSYSMSVRKSENLPSTKPLNAIEFAKSYTRPGKEFRGLENEIFLPELRGEIISGKLSSKTGQDPIENRNVALSVVGKPFAFKISKTNASGEFIFNLEKAYFDSNIIIQVMDNNRTDYTVTLSTPHDIDYSKFSFPTFRNLTPELKENLEKRSIASQIENAYYLKKSDSIAAAEHYKIFYDPLAKDLFLDDYSRFPTIKETIVEVLNEIYFTEENNKYSLHVEDHDPTKEIGQPALVMVDGLLVQDINELFEFSAENIHKVSYVSGGYYYNSNVFNGVINFVTKNNNYEIKSTGGHLIKPTILRPAIHKKYYQPNYANTADSSRIPDYRYQLLWLPELQLKENETDVSFFTSDINGTFEVILNGFTAKGEPISITETFEVK